MIVGQHRLTDEFFPAAAIFCIPYAPDVDNCVHCLMLSMYCFRGLPRLRLPSMSLTRRVDVGMNRSAMEKSVKRFMRLNGLNTAQYKTFIFIYYAKSIFVSLNKQR